MACLAGCLWSVPGCTFRGDCRQVPKLKRDSLLAAVAAQRSSAATCSSNRLWIEQRDDCRALPCRFHSRLKSSPASLLRPGLISPASTFGPPVGVAPAVLALKGG